MTDQDSGSGVSNHDGAVLGPLTEARARGVEARMRLAATAGGLLDLKEAAVRLGATPAAVTWRRSHGTILAVPVSDGEWAFPACQFEGTDLVSELDSFLAAFPQDVSDPWTRLAVLLAPSRRFGGRSALQLLKEGMVHEAQSIAGTYGEQG